MRRMLGTLMLALSVIPLGHGCHAGEEDIRTRWFTIYSAAALPLAASRLKRRPVAATLSVVPVTPDVVVEQPRSTKLAA